jgi:hypothetical protein
MLLTPGGEAAVEIDHPGVGRSVLQATLFLSEEVHDQSGLNKIIARLGVKIVIVTDEEVLPEGVRADVLSLHSEAPIFLIERETVAQAIVASGVQVVVALGVETA